MKTVRQKPYKSIRWIQERLLAHGCNPIYLDGIIGPRTINAIKLFQSKNDLPETGECDEITITKLASTPVTAAPKINSIDNSRTDYDRNAKIVSYNCPNCGAPINYTSNDCVCSYCDSRLHIRYDNLVRNFRSAIISY